MVTVSAAPGPPSPPEEERILFFFRQHWLRLLPHLVRTVIMSILLIAVSLFLLKGLGIGDSGTRHMILILIAFFFLFIQLDFIEQLYNHTLYLIVVSDRRIHRIKRTVFLTNDQQCIELWALQDIYKVQRGIIQNSLGCGTLILEAQESLLKIHFVPGINSKYQALMALREQARRRMDLPGQERSSPPPLPGAGKPLSGSGTVTW